MKNKKIIFTVVTLLAASGIVFYYFRSKKQGKIGFFKKDIPKGKPKGTGLIAKPEARRVEDMPSR